jgi:hypothetical protein
LADMARFAPDTRTTSAILGTSLPNCPDMGPSTDRGNILVKLDRFTSQL